MKSLKELMETEDKLVQLLRQNSEELKTNSSQRIMLQDHNRDLLNRLKVIRESLKLKFDHQINTMTLLDSNTFEDTGNF